MSAPDVYGAYAPPNLPTIALGPNKWYKPDGKSNFDNPVYKQYLELYTAMIKEKSAFPWTEVLSRNLKVYNQDLFLAGQVGMWVSQSWVLRYVKDKDKYPHDFMARPFWPLPAAPGVANSFNGGSIGIYEHLHPKAKNKDLTWQFMRYYVVEGGQRILETGKAPAFPGFDLDAITRGILGPDQELMSVLFDVAAFKKVFGSPSIAYVTDTETRGAASVQKSSTRRPTVS